MHDAFTQRMPDTVVILERGLLQQAAARVHFAPNPFQFLFKQDTQTWFPAWRGQRRLDNAQGEPADHLLYHSELQGLLRLEMCKQSTLGELRLLCQYPYRKTFISNIADDAERMRDDRAPGLFPLRLAFTDLANRRTGLHFYTHGSTHNSTIVRFCKTSMRCDLHH